MRILVVEDDFEYRSIFRDTLQLYGHDVVTANDGLDAWEVLQHSHVDVIISDINMPKCTGSQLHELVRSSEPLKATPFIYATGIGILRVATQRDKTGYDYVVGKVPFDRLLQIVDDLSLDQDGFQRNTLAVRPS